jgi:UDP-N-acetyl-D-glucosamine dehydrogenase
MSLDRKIEDRSALIGVIGLGYVGLPLSGVFCRAGYQTLGFDVDAKKLEALSARRTYLKHLGENFVERLDATGRFQATGDFAKLGEPDALLICVPTPLGTHLEPDFGYVEQTTDAIVENLRRDQLIVLESTTYPSTTRELLLPKLESTGLRCGKDFYLAFSPEREDPGRQDQTTRTIPKLVGGIDAASGRLATALYSSAFERVVAVSSAEVAEAAKLLENVYRAVNVAMINEIKILFEAMDINVWEVIDAAATKPFGFQAFYPGPGLGGHCIPIDPLYLTWKAREIGLPTRFIELAGEINHMMPDYVVRRTALALNDRGKAVRGSRVLVLGLAYKADVDDVRESPAIELIEKLRELGADVDYHDPHVPKTHKMRKHDLQMTSIELSPEAVADYDCVLIATHHSAYDWQMIAKQAKLVVDTRGVMRNVPGDKQHVVRA